MNRRRDALAEFAAGPPRGTGLEDLVAEFMEA
jgi:hypothetical protein